VEWSEGLNEYKILSKANKLSENYTVKLIEAYYESDRMGALAINPLDFVLVEEELTPVVFEKNNWVEQFEKLMVDVFKCLAFLHNSVGILHRDLKPEHFQWTNTKELKLIDFGPSKFIKEGERVECWGTRGFIAPELLDGDFYFQKSIYYGAPDLYSCGISLLFIVCKQIDNSELKKLYEDHTDGTCTKQHHFDAHELKMLRIIRDLCNETKDSKLLFLVNLFSEMLWDNPRKRTTPKYLLQKLEKYNKKIEYENKKVATTSIQTTSTRSSSTTTKIRPQQQTHNENLENENGLINNKSVL